MRPRTLVVFLLALLVLATGIASPQEEGRVFTSGLYGFRVERPEGWTFHQQESAAKSTFSLNVLPPGSKGEVRAYIVAKIGAATGTPKETRDAGLAKMSGRPEYVSPKPMEGTLAGQKSWGIATTYQAPDGRRFFARLNYLEAGGVLYLCQGNAPEGEFKTFAPVFAAIWKSLTFPDASEETLDERKLSPLAARCGTNVAWAKDWEDAAERARRERRLVLVYVRSLSGFQMSDPALSGAFMDPDVAGLVQHRFVPFRWTKGASAPFVSHEVYGLSGSTFGTALLLVSPDGVVLDETFSLKPSTVYSLLLRVLSAHPEFAGPGGPRARAPLGRIADLIQRGDLDGAWERLEGMESAGAHRLRADIHRRRREGEEALRELAAARTAAPDEAADALLLSEGYVQMGLGRLALALTAFERLIEDHPASPYLPQAMYWTGVCRYSKSGKAAAKLAWMRLIDAHPESAWAWRAAGHMRSTGFSLGLSGRVGWPPEELSDELQRPVPSALPISKVAKARADALGWLLAHQQADGSWIHPTSVTRPADKRPHDFDISVTALAARSMDPYREEPEVAAAIDRALAYVLRAHDLNRRSPPPVYYMDYSVWTHACVLGLIADCLDSGVGDEGVLRKASAEVLVALRKLQRDTGGFSYFLTSDLSKTTRPSSESISFVTAAAAHALLDAKESGVRVPEPFIASILLCLERMRGENDAFVYMFRGGKARPVTARPGAAGRGPLCALALQRGGLADLDLVRRTLAIFEKYRETYRREGRKALMHTGLDGQGSHYLMFDYAWVAASIAALPADERTARGRVLLADILAARLDDGSYLDNPLLGRAFGAAMALSAFEILGVPRD